ncbi:MAG: type II CRISPR RNA-guided endonuclease Cas9 [Ignavibacteriaceae bacterium]
MENILGLDLGTNSIGWVIRDSQLEGNQFEKYGVNIFRKGVGEGKTGEFSLAAERTKHRTTRRLYQARKYRLWETLLVLIEHDYCPLSNEDLDKWKIYNKEKGLFRKYPVHATTFEQWIRLDFDNDGLPDYTSPYQLRKELIEQKLDTEIQVNRYKIGRALYHIAQRRGFKSSRKEIKENKEDSNVNTNVLQLSEKKRSSKIEELLSKHNTSTIGAAFAIEENLGNRIRLEWIQYTIRQHYKDEVNKIFEIQTISKDSKLYKGLVETKQNKNDGSIFYKRPLRSQKGLIGKCTLEPSKSRCPLSHPLFEEFRAWAFLNNIQYRIKKEDEWQSLPLTLKEEIYKLKFFRKSKEYFSFVEIREQIESYLTKIGGKVNLDYDNKTINYRDKTNVSGCPVSARIKNILGDNWESYSKEMDQVRIITKKNGYVKEHKISYNYKDIWHILFSFEDEECVGDFAKEKLCLESDEIIKDFITAWRQLPDGYSMLSLNTIEKIIPFLRKGLIYTEAVLLANMPTVLGKEIWEENEEHLINCISDLIEKNRKEKQLLNIVNKLISDWYASEFKVGFKNPYYKLDERDKKLIQKTIIGSYGNKTWESETDNEKEKILNQVTFLFQCFFQDDFEWVRIKDEKYYVIRSGEETFYKNLGSGYYKVPHLLETIKKYLKNRFDMDDKKLDKLYHPSQIDIYPKAKPNSEGKILLQSPKTGSFKNPMAMRTLYELRKLINYLISVGTIDEDTNIVVEVARELNDANMRWAIEAYQRRREEENKEFANAITELLKDPEIFGRINADPESNDDIDKFRLWYEQIKFQKVFKKEPSKIKIDKDGKELENNDPRKYDWNNIRNEIIKKVIEEKDLIKKYRLWKEQKCRCLYTGSIITLSDLFDENVIDFEHTIPRSISFDNSLANLTVCFASYNRNIKKNRIPTELENYSEDTGGFTAIEPRLEDWKNRIEELNVNIEFWRKKSKQAQNKDDRDYAIKQKHLWQLELKYWQNKLERFTMTEVKSGFKNSQLVDTQLISKYAFHYLKSAFNNVSVQKGSITAEFRKIYGIQPKDENKDRNKHTHHAIDAAVLTLIPTSAKREDILRKAFDHYERWKLGLSRKDEGKQYHEKPYQQFKLSHISEIENNILINNIAKDKALTPAKKIVRKRGRIIYLRDGNKKFILDENGKKKSKIITGDTIRGELHKDTFLGAIKKVKRDENHNPIIGEDGKFILENELSYVVREALIYKKDATSAGFNSLEEIKNCIVDPFVYKMIENQVGEKSLKDAIAEGIWMLNKNGEKVNKIRHLRVFVRDKEPLTIKKQTYLSKYEYKNDYYAANATSYLYALYQSEDGKRKFKPLNLFKAAQLKSELDIKKDEDFFEESIFAGKNKKEYKLIGILKPGKRVLFHNADNIEELKELAKKDLLNRLYYVKNLFDAKTGTIQFQYHLEARSDRKISEAFPKENYGQKGKNGFSEFNFEKPWPRLLLSPVNFNFLIEGKNFGIEADDEIIFK